MESIQQIGDLWVIIIPCAHTNKIFYRVYLNHSQFQRYQDWKNGCGRIDEMLHDVSAYERQLLEYGA